MDKVSCLKRIAKKLGVAVTDADTTVCDVLHKIGEGDALDHKFVVTVTGDTSAATADKTIAEIYAAHQAGKVVECHYSAFALHPLMISESVCSFSCDVMSAATTCQRTTINITSAGAGIAVLNYELTPVA
ncbi:hypothetical protein [Priestia megaterium]|uniref:hypothetical protein n=1 Tax=Priestia megaterium TaxID=1404 RepID=UPI002E21900E|nr:hypothetical protein [Priestia megaterium]